MHYNEAQLCAIRHTDGPCMVLAGPGSGKTTVITERIRMLTEEKKVNPENILVITFTRAAAEEMKARYLRKTDGEGQGVIFGTFHSVFYRMLCQEYRLPEESLIKEYEKVSIVKKILSGIGPEYCEDRELLYAVLSEISKIKNTGKITKNPAGISAELPMERVYRAYEREKKKRQKIDFDDMLTQCLEMLRKKPAVLEKWQEKFRYILIDEFQDINRVQYEIVSLLALPENNLFIVGDDDQSVYAFRGAEPGIMLGFPEDYRDAAKILLNVNYRCVSSIAEASARLIRHNKNRYEKEVHAEKHGEGAVELHAYPDVKAEYEAAASVVKSVSEEKASGGRVAVLTRTNQGISEFASVLTAKNIPFRTKDKQPNLFRHEVLNPLYAALNWTLGNRSRANFLKFMNCPVRFIRRSDLTSETVDPEALKEFYAADPERTWMTDRIDFLLYQLGMLERVRTPFAMINYFRKGMEYDRYLKEQADEKGREVQPLLSVLDAVQESAEPFESVEDWYAHIVRVTKELERREAGAGGTDDARVLLTTLHGSKGLEFETVLILDVNEKTIPHELSSGGAEIEEERRMFYVGMTRAAKKLHLFSADEHYGKKTEKSRFIKEIM